MLYEYMYACKNSVYYVSACCPMGTELGSPIGATRSLNC